MPWTKRAFESLTFGSNVAFFLFLATTVPFCAWLYGQKVHDPTSLALSVVPQAFAALGLTVLSLAWPALTGLKQMAFPLNFTLPTVYCSLVLLATTLTSNILPPITTLGDEPRFDRAWADMRILAVGWIWQTTLLTTSGAMAKRKMEAPKS